ncbi:hypothetical protein I6L27_15715 [Acinetobacter pittii]|uniref:DUF7226 domain-containing protein n=1 Tax=Acinetobacter pittii TaxID=48296 RepID=UPI001C22ABF0|nr:hypothetical protein [Acinetobacter pittii]QXA07327.1 hypothetical protein I6L27_15715 [Acinetobacter pittii]
MPLETSDFLQADDIEKVFLVVDAVATGAATDSQIEAYLGLDSGSRQGRYYRLAAEKLGLIMNNDNSAILTQRGQVFYTAPLAVKTNEARNLIASSPVFANVINHFRHQNPINRNDLYKYFIDIYPGSDLTAQRRFSTFQKYMAYLNLSVA